MHLKNIQYDQIYSSDLERALETATIISQNNLNDSTDINDIKQTKLLRERAFGIYDLTGKNDFIRIAQRLVSKMMKISDQRMEKKVPTV